MERKVLVIGCNSEAGSELIATLNFELPHGDLPEWLELVPRGPEVVGRDGRKWLNDRPEGVVEAFNTAGADVPFDIAHATEIKAPKGEEAPAVGWIKEMQLRDGAVWGRVEWNAIGKKAIEGKEYRYYSPAFLYKKSNGRIAAISSTGLTNKPNLRVAALNHQLSSEEDNAMLKQLLKALGLPEDATVDQALNAITTMKSDLAIALNRAQTPDLDKFVPRADHDALLARATNAEQTLAARDKAELEGKITAAVDGALKAGKIVPASKDYYMAMCQQEGGLEQFEKFLETAPVIGDPSTLDKKPPEGDGKALNAQEKKVIENMGITEEEYLKTSV